MRVNEIVRVVEEHGGVERGMASCDLVASIEGSPMVELMFRAETLEGPWLAFAWAGRRALHLEGGTPLVDASTVGAFLRESKALARVAA